MKKMALVTSIYLLMQFIYYLILHTTKLIDFYVGCYIVIIIDVIVSIIIALLIKVKYSYIIVIAQIFTLLADTFLTLLDRYYIIGLSFFICAQIAYYIYILSLDSFKFNKNHQIFGFLRVILIIAFLILLLIKKTFDIIIVLTGIYFSMLVLNFIESFITIKINFMLPIALFLFILCDVCVGCLNIIDIFPINTSSLIYKIATSNINWAWLFYHPSQVILSMICLFQNSICKK